MNVIASRSERSRPVTIKLGMFTMPFHHPSRDYADLLRLYDLEPVHET